ncbi:hypothetical protein GHYDROH2_26050 [Geobacter hydrogenophilus]|uniref:Uncharacterized protein n=1 Tax=Geobacter hydrogenophilus TaxID=40983 RepID=A0A9W6LDW1_9BACT|nr:hypothetical protein GHYDROH2_26050 [Geobacter hydrogenophilus]
MEMLAPASWDSSLMLTPFNPRSAKSCVPTSINLLRQSGLVISLPTRVDVSAAKSSKVPF